MAALAWLSGFLLRPASLGCDDLGELEKLLGALKQLKAGLRLDCSVVNA